ncbi:hypothetical protein Bca4012_030046 [Brassica carinata]
MVSQSNAAGSSGRRRRPNTLKAKPVSRSKKTKRYPVSDSYADTMPSSMDSTAPTSPPVDAVDSKANVIASVVSALKGSSAMDRLLCSQFSKLFQLPVARCPNSTKLIGSLLCRQLITIRKYELWFTFGNHPLRFSVDEFKEITGLNCGVFDVEDSETEVNEQGSMWKQLFDTTVDDFLDNPSCCGNTVVILNTNDIVAVEGEPDVIVDFSLVPEAERHFWLDEVEDPKVTRLVDHIRSGHTFRTEDFEGGDRSFGKDNAIPEGKPQGVPLIQRTLRPRKRAAVVIEDLTTPEHNEPDVPPESGRSPNEDLKSWILEQFQNFKNGIYELLDKFEKTLCDHFGVPLPNIHNKGKRKGTIGNTQPGFSRKTHENNENSTLLTPQFDQNATDQKDDTYNGEKAVDVKWDEANPHAYSSVKEVPAGESPSSDPNPESAPDFASTRSEENVGPVSTNLSGQKTQAPVIEGGVPDSMAVQNPTSPVEEDENYESCKENISFDS